MELIPREEVMRLAESGKLGSFGERAKDIIKAIPTIEERKEGHWIILEEPKYGIPKRWRVRCPICRKTLKLRDRELWEFCPRCGAKMKGE